MKCLMKPRSWLQLGCVLTLIAFVTIGCSRTSEAFQRDADIIRHRHLRYYAQALQEYREKKGFYPMADPSSNIQTYVFIANDQQEQFATNPPYTINRVPPKAFFQDLQTVLGREFNEYYDPQYRPDYKPNFYIYLAIDTFYYFAVHVSHEYPYSKRIGPHYYKIELSNNQLADSKTISIDDLLSDSTFIRECNGTPDKEGFFKQREEKYLHYSQGK